MKREIRIPKQKRSIEKKNRIVEAAYKLFNEKGYHNTNTAEIAKEAGLSTGCLYDYFIDKDDIFIDTLKMHNEEIHTFIRSGLTNLPEDIDLLTFMKQFITIFLEAHSHSKGFHKEVMALSFTNPSIQDYVLPYDDPALLSAFNAFFTRHYIVLENPNEKILLLINTVDHLCHDLLYQEYHNIDIDLYKDECAKMLCTFFTA